MTPDHYGIDFIDFTGFVPTSHDHKEAPTMSNPFLITEPETTKTVTHTDMLARALEVGDKIVGSYFGTGPVALTVKRIESSEPYGQVKFDTNEFGLVTLDSHKDITIERKVTVPGAEKRLPIPNGTVVRSVYHYDRGTVYLRNPNGWTNGMGRTYPHADVDGRIFRGTVEVIVP